jgi:hypothetical protein
MEETIRPEYITEAYLVYLDTLRETGITNMFGAAPYLEDTYPELSRAQSREVLKYWMHTFSERQDAKETT